jgi:hypothetical protein
MNDIKFVTDVSDHLSYQFGAMQRAEKLCLVSRVLRYDLCWCGDFTDQHGCTES